MYNCMAYTSLAESKVENSALVLSCQLRFVHGPYQAIFVTFKLAYSNVNDNFSIIVEWSKLQRVTT